MKNKVMGGLKFLTKAIEENWIVVATLILISFKLIYVNEIIGLYDWSRSLSKILLVSSLLIAGSLVFWTLFLKEKARIVANIAINAVFSIIVVADLVYLRFFKALPSINSIFYIDQAGEVQDSILKLLKPMDALFIADVLILAIFVIVSRQTFKQKNLEGLSIKANRILGLSVGALLLVSSLFVLRHDKENFTLLYRQSYDSKMIVARYNILGYHFMDISRLVSSRLRKISSEEAGQLIGWLKDNKATSQPDNSMTGVAKGKNVIVLQVESLQNAVIGQKLENQEVTPNLNKLIGSSYYFDNYYYQMGLGGTSDTDFSVNTSFYPLDDASVFVRYGKNDFSSLPKEMIKAGYDANAYHGFDRSFWNRNVSYKSLGYEKFLGAESYPKDPKIGMGIGDKEFLEKTADYMAQDKKPSLSYVITLSNHFPFTDPEKYAPIKLNKGNYTAEAYNYLTSVNYTDAAIGNFIQKLKDKGLYDNSVIVIYGDHFANIGDTTAKSTKAAFNIPQGNDKAAYLHLKKVPLIIHLPNQEKAEKISDPASHIDVMPTILNLAGLKTTAPMFGRDLFGGSQPYFGSVLYYFDGIAMDKKYTYLYGKIKGLGNGECYLNANWQKMDAKECANLEKKRDNEITNDKEIVTFNLLKGLLGAIAQTK